MAAYGYLSGNITGRAGLYNQQKQKVRRDANWKPMTAFGVYYGDIPAVSDWLSLTIDIMDNATAMESFDTGELLRTMGYVIGANMLERTQLQNIEQFNDVLKGDPAAIQRWAANTAFTTTNKVGGMLGTMNQLISPQLKAVENRFIDMYTNRIPGKPGLADKYDYIDGGEAKDYLMDVEFDATPSLANSFGGTPYTKTEQQDVLRIMGEQGYYKQEILRLKEKYPVDMIKKAFHKASRLGLNPSISDIDMIHNELDMALSNAKMMAEQELGMEFHTRKIEEKVNEESTKAYMQMGDYEEAAGQDSTTTPQEFLQEMGSLSY